MGKPYENPFVGYVQPMPRALHRAGFAQRFAEVGGVTLSYAQGPPAGPPLVLVPAQMALWLTYAPVMPALAERFEVFAVDVRGHGSSSWTPGDYSWDSVGGDLARFLETVVGRPAIVSGNSSGGVLALWLAVEVPAFVRAIVLEDAPVFSVEMPRFRDRDRFVYEGLASFVRKLGDRENRRLADYFRGQVLPVSERRVKRLPDRVVNLLDRAVTSYERRHPGQPSGVDAWWLPRLMDELMRSLSMFDPDFARAFVDGRFYGDFSHERALRAVRCPVLVLHGDWHRYETYGLVGALDDDDVRRIVELVPRAEVRRIHANHVLHRYRPRQFIDAVLDFAARV
jgi:pimeloyl-ACP methyl ester carboxylesterase